MKLIRLIAPTSTSIKSEFTNRFEDDIKVMEDSEVALVNCTIPISLENLVTISADNASFTLKIKGESDVTVTLNQGEYPIGDFLAEVERALYAAIPADIEGLEFKAVLQENNSMRIYWDRTALSYLGAQTSHIRVRTWNGTEQMVFEQVHPKKRNKGTWQRKGQAAGENDAWVFCDRPFSKGNATMEAYSGKTFDRNAHGKKSSHWWMGLIIRKPSEIGQANEFNPIAVTNYNPMLQHGFYVWSSVGSSEFDWTTDAVTVIHDGGLRSAMLSGEPKDALFSMKKVRNQMRYYCRNKDGETLWDSLTAGDHGMTLTTDKEYLYETISDPLLPLYPIFGLGKTHIQTGMVKFPAYTPSTSAIEEPGFERVDTRLTMVFPSDLTRLLFGFGSLEMVSYNYHDYGVFSGTAPLNNSQTIGSIVVYLNNLTLECYDGGQPSIGSDDTVYGYGDKGRRRSIIGVIPATYRHQYYVGYEPNNLQWIELNNKFPMNMREIEWGFAEGNTFAPFSALNSIVTLAIRQRQ